MTVARGDQVALWVLSVKDKRMTPFGEVKSITQIDASFSPDGRWVAYHTRQTLNPSLNEIFIEPFPSTGIKHLVPQAGGAPYWLPTTPRVAFGRPAEFSRVGRLEVSPSTSRRNVDAMPDGEHVIGVVSAASVESGIASQITVVLNWFDDVRKRVPVK